MDKLIEEWKKKIDPSQVARFEANLPRKDEFLTVEKCKTCHVKQYENWKNTKHSHAMASLAETGDQHRYDCVGCHSLGYGEAYLDTSKIGVFADVQCESCHGTNAQHVQDPKKFTFSKVGARRLHRLPQQRATPHRIQLRRGEAQVQCPKG
jgi:hypothetical protein